MISSGPRRSGLNERLERDSGRFDHAPNVVTGRSGHRPDDRAESRGASRAAPSPPTTKDVVAVPSLRILVIEDSADGREILRTLLEAEGHHVFIAEGRTDLCRDITRRPTLCRTHRYWSPGFRRVCGWQAHSDGGRGLGAAGKSRRGRTAYSTQRLDGDLHGHPIALFDASQC
jgi:hypothetical protein